MNITASVDTVVHSYVTIPQILISRQRLIGYAKKLNSKCFPYIYPHYGITENETNVVQ